MTITTDIYKIEEIYCSVRYDDVYNNIAYKKYQGMWGTTGYQYVINVMLHMVYNILFIIYIDII